MFKDALIDKLAETQEQFNVSNANTNVGFFGTASDVIQRILNSQQMATGGVVRQATAAIIGEDGAEAVVPLEKNTGWIDMLAEKLGGKAGGVTVNQTNNYASAHSRYEIFKSQQNIERSVKLALMG